MKTGFVLLISLLAIGCGTEKPPTHGNPDLAQPGPDGSAMDMGTNAQMPSLIIKSPSVDEVAVGKLHLDVSCESPLGTCEISVAPGDCSAAPLASGSNHLDTSIDVTAIAAADSQILCFSAVDGAGNQLSVSRRVYVETSAAYQRAYDAAQEILAANLEQDPWQIVRANRSWPSTYTVDTRVDEAQPMAIVLESGQTNPTSTTITGSFDRANDRAYVAASGAVLYSHLNAEAELYAWSAAAGSSQIGSISSPPVIRGDWAAFKNGTDLYTYQFSKAAANKIGSGQSIDVGANGVAAYTTAVTTAGCTGGDLYLGATKAGSASANADVRTDGALAIFRTAICSGQYQVALFDGATVTPAPASTLGFVADYKVNNGWAVFLVEADSSAGGNHVQRRSPQGVETTVAQPTGDPLALETVGSDGSFTYVSGTTRHLVDAQGKDSAIGFPHGRAQWTKAGWYVALGRSIFKIAP
jgi:hypothetical protein